MKKMDLFKKAEIIQSKKELKAVVGGVSISDDDGDSRYDDNGTSYYDDNGMSFYDDNGASYFDDNGPILK